MTEKRMGKIKKGCVFAVFQMVLYYGFLSGKLANPDALWNGTVFKSSWTWEVSLGRYMLGLYQMMMNDTVNPAFMTFMGIILSSMAALALLDFLGIKGYKQQFAGAALLLTAPFIWCTYTYYFCSAYYMLAYLLIALALLLSGSDRYRVWQRIAGAALMICLSLATYQAYISVFITGGLIWIFSRLMRRETSAITVLHKAGEFVTSLFMGVVLYLLSNRVIQEILDVAPADSRGFDSMGQLDMTSMTSVLQQIYRCYTYTVRYFLCDTMICNSYGWIPRYLINLIYFAITAVILFVIFADRRNSGRKKTVAFICLLLLPLALMCITVLAPDVSILNSTGSIMLTAMNLVYLLPIILIGEERNTSGRILHGLSYGWMVSAGLTVIMLAELGLDAQTYLGYCMDKTAHVAEEMTARIDAVSDKKFSDNRICIIGKMENGNYPEPFPELKESVHWTTAVYGTIWDDYIAVQSCWSGYIRDDMGAKYVSCSAEEYNDILKTEEYQEMQNFPEQNSVREINGIVVVKLSEEE